MLYTYIPVFNLLGRGGGGGGFSKHFSYLHELTVNYCKNCHKCDFCLSDLIRRDLREHKSELSFEGMIPVPLWRHILWATTSKYES